MSNTIRIKRRAAAGGAGAPSSLANAELAFNEASNILYYGTGTGGAGAGTRAVGRPGCPAGSRGAGAASIHEISNLRGMWCDARADLHPKPCSDCKDDDKRPGAA